MMRKFCLFFLMALALAGCVGSQTYNYKVNTKPYTINGVTYYPMASADGFVEKGIASWYGPSFHGKKTASGQVYDKYAYTAAHKTLPFGAQVKVTNLDNGMTTRVVINDRGPFKSGRIIDLSYSAAQDIGMVRTGTARVRIEVIGSVNSVKEQKSEQNKTQQVSRSVTSIKSSGNSVGMYGVPPNQIDETGATQGIEQSKGTYYVQVGAYSLRDNADKAGNRLSKRGYAYALRQHNGKHIVVVGPYGTRARAATARDDLRKTYSGAFIVE